MIGLCSIGFFFLTLATGVYAVFGGFREAREDFHFPPWGLPWEDGSSSIGIDWFDIIYRKFFVIFACGYYIIKILVQNYVHGALIIFAGLVAYLTIRFYFPPYNEGILGGCVLLVFVWRVIKNTSAKRSPQKSIPSPQSNPLQQSPSPPAPTQVEYANLGEVYEICTMYLVALDEQFTPEEQELVDQHFGPGTADRFIQKLPSITWEEQFAELHDLVSRLSPSDRFQLKTHGRTFFQSILSADDFTASEKTRFDEILRFLDESMGHEPLT